ncbi:nuclear transport factor 2 family protein [Nocardia amikacinitolerans]|uniref:nuclear transport factor 2 family protein n=1 Tax=Nocardia amikacinitolerans TaxID=756689 RepID=UPI00367F771B
MNEVSSREVVERMFAELLARDADAFGTLLAPDAVLEIPFPIPGLPTRLEGREAIREHMAQRWGGSSCSMEVHGIYPQVYETTDPELVFVENDVDMTLATGERFRTRTSVSAIRVRGGQVVLFRDYMGSAQTAQPAQS